MMKEYLNKIKNDIQSCKGCRCCKVRFGYIYYYDKCLYCEKYQKHISENIRLKEQYEKLKEKCNCNKSHISIIKVIDIIGYHIMNIIDDICEHIEDIYYHRNEVDKE